MKAWWIELGHAWRAALATIRRQPIGWLAGAGVVATAVILPVLLHLALAALAPAARALSADPEISIYLMLDATPADFRQAQSAIEAQITALRAAEPRARAVVFAVPKAEALKQFRVQAERTGTAQALDALKDNPLPDGFVIRLSAVSAEAVTTLAQRLRAVPKVDAARVDTEWVRRLGAAVQAAAVVQWLLAALFGLVVVAVTFNVTHAQVLAARDEIEVARLVGATQAFIRRPFVIRGALLGATGAVFALGTAALVVYALGDLFGALPGPAAAWREALVVFSVVTALGGAGGWWSAARHLRRLGA